jgi:hypothetical protein
MNEKSKMGVYSKKIVLFKRDMKDVPTIVNTPLIPTREGKFKFGNPKVEETRSLRCGCHEVCVVFILNRDDNRKESLIMREVIT